MGRPRSTAGGRPVPISARFSVEEAQDIDERRGSLSRSEWIRWLVARARREGVRMQEVRL